MAVAAACNTRGVLILRLNNTPPLPPQVGSGSKGLFCENGSGGWMADLVITGGTTGMQIGNQQWTMRNISISGSRSICLDLIWDWQFVLMGLNLANCPTGVHFQGNIAGSVIIQDSTFTNIPTGELQRTSFKAVLFLLRGNPII